jgi:kynurenine formamidase
MVSNTGTYIDAPFHRYVDGEDISQLNLEKLSNVEGVLIPIPSNATAIDESFFLNVEVTEKAVLIRTGWSRHWKTEQYFEGHPYLTERAAAVLRDKGARIVGIDSYNIDDIMDGKRPVHSVLLRSGIPIVEHLCNLEQLPDRPFAFSAIPAKIKGCGTFPVRAYAAYASKAQS